MKRAPAGANGKAAAVEEGTKEVEKGVAERGEQPELVVAAVGTGVKAKAGTVSKVEAETELEVRVKVEVEVEVYSGAGAEGGVHTAAKEAQAHPVEAETGARAVNMLVDDRAMDDRAETEAEAIATAAAVAARTAACAVGIEAEEMAAAAAKAVDEAAAASAAVAAKAEVGIPSFESSPSHQTHPYPARPDTSQLSST